MKSIYLLLLLFLSCQVSAQSLDSIQTLRPVTLWATNLKEYSEGYTQKIISDSLLSRSSGTFTDMLESNSLIYFKENGLGMVSSPSFRGTNASQTAVLWNGIPINSLFTGQTDFNTVMFGNVDELTIRSGSGSVPFGSGAIGGSILLDNLPKFDQNNEHQVKLGYGSFDTYSGQIRSLISNENFYINISVEGLQSENDYKYPHTDQRNKEAAYYHYNFGGSVGWRKNNHRLYIHSQWYEGKRDFAGTLTAPARDGYRDYNTRNLFHWETYMGRWTSSLKIAHLHEAYRYYPNKKQKEYSYGKSNTLWTDYSWAYRLNTDILITGILQYNNIQGKGTDIEKAYRNTGAAIVMLKHHLLDNWTYGLHLRQEFLNGFDNPFLFAFDTRYRLTSAYSVHLNAAKNYRVPTFNDLFWKSGGNLNLKPEESVQIEVGNSWDRPSYGFSAVAFFIDSKDMLKWVPMGSLWRPINLSKVQNYGGELEAYYIKEVGNHYLRAEIAYAYTKAIDRELNKQLIYVPYHKYTALLKYQYRNWNASYQVVFNGEVYTSSDNIGKHKEYDVHRLALEYRYSLAKADAWIGVRIKNLYDTYYENLPSRPMPGRNLDLYINFKF